MKQLIDEALIKMNTNEFLSNINKVFNDLFSSANIDKINLMNYLIQLYGIFPILIWMCFP